MKKIKYLDISNTLKSNLINFHSNLDKSSTFTGIKSIESADKNDLSFFSNIKYINKLQNCNAKACIINSNYSQYLPKDCEPIIVSDPYYVFALLTKLFQSDMNFSNGIISSNSFIHKDSKINNNVQIDSFSYIDKDTEISDNCVIGPSCKIGPKVTIGKNCFIHNNVTLSDCTIYDNCEIKSGARIGLTGFGFEEKSKMKIHHIGNVIIKNNSTIGANTTIDKAVFESTSIGEYSQIDNLVQIAHNVTIGKHAIIAAQVGIAGSTNIGDYVKIGGQSGISGHLTIGNNVTIAGKSGVTKDIPNNKVVAGFPAKDIRIWKREVVKMSKGL